MTKAGADFGDFGRKLENLGLPVTSLRENLHQAYLDCLIFVQRNKNYSGFAQDATHKPTTHHLTYNSFQNHKPSFGEHFILLSYGCSADNAVVK